MPMRRGMGGILTAGLACVVLVAGETVAGPVVVAADGATHVTVLVGNPSSLVNPLAGTGAGAVNPGAIGEFPGAELPFGMIQWSPNTTPNVAMSGSGYSYADSVISGFSLTNLSGVGCAAYGDVPILPTVGPIGGTPETTTQTLHHLPGRAAPRRDAVA